MRVPLLVLGLIVVGSSVIQLVSVALYSWRTTWKHRRRIVATVKQIQVQYRMKLYKHILLLSEQEGVLRLLVCSGEWPGSYAVPLMYL